MFDYLLCALAGAIICWCFLNAYSRYLLARDFKQLSDADLATLAQLAQLEAGWRAMQGGYDYNPQNNTWARAADVAPTPMAAPPVVYTFDDLPKPN